MDTTILNKHIMSHTDEKPYQCHDCANDFINNDTFIEHMKKHNSEKSYKCRYCQKSFLNKIHLKRHMRRHIGEKSYQCSKSDNGSSSCQEMAKPKEQVNQQVRKELRYQGLVT